MTIHEAMQVLCPRDPDVQLRTTADVCARTIHILDEIADRWSRARDCDREAYEVISDLTVAAFMSAANLRRRELNDPSTFVVR